MRRPLVALFLLPLLSGCFTTALWGGSIHDEDHDGVSEVDLGGDEAGDTPLVAKILLTPFTLVLDLCTSPVQAWMFGWDDEDDEDC